MQQRQNGDTGISVREPNLTGAIQTTDFVQGLRERERRVGFLSSPPGTKLWREPMRLILLPKRRTTPAAGRARRGLEPARLVVESTARGGCCAMLWWRRCRARSGSCRASGRAFASQDRSLSSPRLSGRVSTLAEHGRT